MKVQCIDSDRISILPREIIENILTLMPIQEALRTSCLSKNWRYYWTGMPTLVFYEMCKPLIDNSHPSYPLIMQLLRSKLANIILHVLLFHKGPILEFSLYVSHAEMVHELNQIILHLSKNNNVKKIIFQILPNYYRLPSLFFSMQELEIIEISNCVFEPPLTFNGFKELWRVCFTNVTISAKTLRRFLSNSPQIAQFLLCGSQENFQGGHEFTFVELLHCLPFIETLKIFEYYMKFFAAGGMPQTLPTSLIDLTNLYLDVCFMDNDELSSTLCMIKSSPNLERIILTMSYDKKLLVRPTSMTFFGDQNYSSFSLDYLEELRMVNVCNETLQMDFVKLIIAKAPELEKAVIELNADVSVDEEVKMLKDLIYLPVPRASPSAKIIIQRPETPHEG